MMRTLFVAAVLALAAPAASYAQLDQPDPVEQFDEIEPTAPADPVDPMDPAAPVDEPDQLEPIDRLSWTEALEVGQWTRVSQTADGAAFVRGLDLRSDGVRRAWVRVEARPGAIPAAMSAVNLEEFDCAEGRSRSLQRTYFEQQNMTGQADTRTDTGTWSYPLPDTMQGLILEHVCKAPE